MLYVLQPHNYRRVDALFWPPGHSSAHPLIHTLTLLKIKNILKLTLYEKLGRQKS